METITWKGMENIPVFAESDVVVIGAGPGGFAAALAAAENGASVVLVERYGTPGGMAFHGEISPFMPNHINLGTDEEPIWECLDKPVFTKWCRQIWEYGSDKRKEALPFKPEERLKYLDKNAAMLAVEDLLLAAGVKIYYHHTLVGVVMDGRDIAYAVFHSKSGFSAVKGTSFVDGTGDGDLAFEAGCRTMFGNEDGYCQPMTLCFKLGNVDTARVPLIEEVNRLYVEAKAKGEMEGCLRHNVLLFGTEEKDAIHFNTTRIVMKNAVNGVELSEAEIEGRRQLRLFLKFLRKYVPGYENAELLSIADHVGVRESRRVLCRTYQEVSDFDEARTYPDGIARIRYMVDIHNPKGSGTTIRRMPAGKWYEIKYTSIVAADCDNLLIGCRAISVDHALHSSSRVMPPVCSVGQAAGMACALAKKQNCKVSEVDGVLLRQALKEYGASL